MFDEYGNKDIPKAYEDWLDSNLAVGNDPEDYTKNSFLVDMLGVTSYNPDWIEWFGGEARKILKAVLDCNQKEYFELEGLSPVNDTLLSTTYYFVVNLIENDVEWGTNIEHCFFKSFEVKKFYASLLGWLDS